MTRAPLPGKLPEWPESQVYDLAMMIRRLVRRMDAVAPGDKLSEQAMLLLRKYGLEGQVMRGPLPEEDRT